MGLQGQTDLHNAEAQQDKTNGTDQPEDKGRQVVDNGNGVVGGKRRNRSAEDECRTHNSGAVNAEALLDLAGHRQLGGVLLGFLLKNVHSSYLRNFEVVVVFSELKSSSDNSS